MKELTELREEIKALVKQVKRVANAQAVLALKAVPMGYLEKHCSWTSEDDDRVLKKLLEDLR